MFECPATGRGVAVNIFRVKDGRLVEHWEVMQPEVAQTVSGNPMFTLA